MFTIEHEFDCTVVTLLDEGATHQQEDVTICSFDTCVTLEQFDPISETVNKVTLSMDQIQDLVASLSLPEGCYTHQTAQ